MTSNTPFLPTRLIMLSELSTKEKEFYYNILIRNECKFHRNENGQYVVNLRLLAPGIKKIDTSKKKKDSQQTNSFPFEERLKLLQDDNRAIVRIVGVEEFDYNSYPRFSLLISADGATVQPRLKLLSWLMRYIEDLYDSRYAHEAAEIGREESYETAEKVSSIFPVFVVKRLSMKLGLRSIVEQTCWDLLYNAHTYRSDYLEVEMFCRFLQEFYDHDDLLFFLYVRSVVAKQLHVSFKTRWGKSDGPGKQPKSLWLSYRECVAVARAVFGESNELMCRDFLAIVSPQMVGQKSEPNPNGIGGGTDTRRIDITQFLHLAVVGYHQTRPPEDGEDYNYSNNNNNNNVGNINNSNINGNNINGNNNRNGYSTNSKDFGQQQQSQFQSQSQDRNNLQRGESMGGIGLPGLTSSSYRTLPGEVNPPVPSVAPSGGDYMSRFAPRSLSTNPISSSSQQPSNLLSEQLYNETDYSYKDPIQDSLNVDDEYLTRMARDREEILEMQRQIERLNSTGGYDYNDYDRNKDNSMAFNFNPDSDFIDHNAYDNNIDLSALAAGTSSYTPIPQSSTFKYDDRNEDPERPPSRTPGNTQKRGTKSHPTLADFTKQRHQMAQLEEQFAIPEIKELKKQGSTASYHNLNEYDDVLQPDSEHHHNRWNNYNDKIDQDNNDYDEYNYNDNRNEYEHEYEHNDNDNNDNKYLPNEEEHDMRIFSEIQAAREKEFLELFCERLSGYPEEIAISIIDELAERLREKLTKYLGTLGPINDPDYFDDVIVNYLQSEELQSDLENARDLMIDYVDKRTKQLKDQRQQSSSNPTRNFQPQKQLQQQYQGNYNDNEDNENNENEYSPDEYGDGYDDYDQEVGRERERERARAISGNGNGDNGKEYDELYPNQPEYDEYNDEFLQSHHDQDDENEDDQEEYNINNDNYGYNDQDNYDENDYGGLELGEGNDQDDIYEQRKYYQNMRGFSQQGNNNNGDDDDDDGGYGDDNEEED